MTAKKSKVIVAVILLVVISITGCSTNKELEKKDNIINKQKDDVSSYQDKLDVLNNEIDELIEKNTEYVNNNKSLENTIDNLKTEIETLEDFNEDKDILIESLEYDMNELQIDEVSSMDINSELVVFDGYFNQMQNFRENRKMLINDILGKEEARELFFKAQNYYWFNIMIPLNTVFTPKVTYSELYEEIEDNESLKNWYILSINDSSITKEDLRDKFKQYFSDKTIAEFDRLFFDFGEGFNEINLKDDQHYGVLNNKVYTRLHGGISALPFEILEEYTTLKLEYISKERDIIRYKIIMPCLKFDDYMNEFDEIYYLEESVEFKLTDIGWRLNMIPNTFKD